MAYFQTRKIRKKPPLKLLKKAKEGLSHLFSALSSTNRKQRSYILGFVLVLVGALIVFKVTSGIYSAIRNFDPKDAVLSLGTDLKKDENGFTNIVLLGDGGHERDGADLVDTIIVASLDIKGGAVSMFSIPRDYYVKGDGIRSGKINEVYRDNKKELGENGAYEVFQKVAGHITNLDVQYYARIDFSAFVEVVDSLGGITVDVKESIYDPYYPNETDDGYTVFEIGAGPQEMNGETALKFVRSRKTTSDFDRAARQQQVLEAIRDKATKNDVLSNPNIIKKLYQSISQNLNTNLSVREMIALGAFAKNFDRKNLVSKVIHDDPSREGGFLYTPERQYYDGQFVLVPDGDNLDLIHQYADLIFHHRDIYIEPATIEVLNATKEPGVARAKASFLKRFGFKIENIDNLTDRKGEKKNVEKSFIRYNSWEVDGSGNVIPHFQSTLEALAGFVKGEPMPNDELKADNKANISVIIGADD